MQKIKDPRKGYLKIKGSLIPFVTTYKLHPDWYNPAVLRITNKTDKQIQDIELFNLIQRQYPIDPRIEISNFHNISFLEFAGSLFANPLNVGYVGVSVHEVKQNLSKDITIHIFDKHIDHLNFIEQKYDEDGSQVIKYKFRLNTQTLFCIESLHPKQKIIITFYPEDFFASPIKRIFKLIILKLTIYFPA
jgi:hypothetical protein